MVYPDQEAYDPYKPDAGDGLFPNGSWVAPPNPANIYTPWTPANASVWLKSLATKPTFVTVDNEVRRDVTKNSVYTNHGARLRLHLTLIKICTQSKAAVLVIMQTLLTAVV